MSCRPPRMTLKLEMLTSFPMVIPASPPKKHWNPMVQPFPIRMFCGLTTRVPRRIATSLPIFHPEGRRYAWRTAWNGTPVISMLKRAAPT